MSRRQPRVSGTFRDRLDRLVAVATEHAEPGGVYVQCIAHDDWCPTLRTQRLVDCRCEPEFRAPRRVA